MPGTRGTRANSSPVVNRTIKEKRRIRISRNFLFFTGSEKAFAAGADIKQMQHRKFAENFQENFLGHWGNIANVRKPIIAAVNGFALGGGKFYD